MDTSESFSIDETSTQGDDFMLKEVEDDAPPEPKFAVFEKCYAKDNTTPLLYEAIIRKLVYAPLNKKVNVGLVENPDDAPEIDEIQAIMDDEPIMKWHYFVHYQGWAPKFDRWVDEDQLFKYGKDAEVLAKRLKEASKCIRKASSATKVTELLQGLVRLEQELREKQAKGETIEVSTVTLEQKAKEIKPPIKPVLSNTKVDDEMMVKNQIFVEKERKLRMGSQSSKKSSITLPFTLKKILTEDWEIISQCGMVHHIPSSKTAMDALYDYLEMKMTMIEGNVSTPPSETPEEKKDHDLMNSHIPNLGSDAISSEKKEWADMVQGMAIFFDQSLPKRLLYTHEIPQCLLLDPDSEKRYCELYPCEHLIRMCIRIPDLLTESGLDEEEKGKIIFKIGDFIRFLQKNQDVYFLQRYRHATQEERTKVEKMMKRLGLITDDESEKKETEEVESEVHVEVDKGDSKKTSKRVSKKPKLQ